MASLYELTENALHLNQLLELGEVDEAAIYDAILKNNEEIGIKLEYYAKMIKNLESDPERRKSHENHIANLKRAMLAALALTGGSVVMDETYLENIPEYCIIGSEKED